MPKIQVPADCAGSAFSHMPDKRVSDSDLFLTSEVSVSSSSTRSPGQMPQVPLAIFGTSGTLGGALLEVLQSCK